MFLFPVSLSYCPLCFHISPNLSIALLFLELYFFRFWYQTVFSEYLLPFFVHFLPISLLGLHEVATFDFLSSFYLYLFMKAVKWSLRPRAVTANSSQLFKLSAIFLTSNLLSYIPLLVIPLVIRMSFSLFPNMIELRRGKRFVYSLFRTWWWNVIPRAKKSNVKWKREKEIVQYGGFYLPFKNNSTTYSNWSGVAIHSFLIRLKTP